MLDLPAPRHLLDHQLGIHRHRDLGGAQPGGVRQTRDQTAIFGDVVGGDTDRLLALGQHGRPVRGPHHRPVARRPRVAARSTVGLDDHLHGRAPLTRNRDCAALRAAQHLVFGGRSDPGHLAAVDLDPARPAATALQRARPGAAAGPLPLVQRHQFGIQRRDELVAPRRVKPAQVFDIAQCGVQSVLRRGQFGVQRLDDGLLSGLLALQLLAVFHHFQQRILQAGLAAFQGLQLVLQFRQLLGVGHRLQQRTVPILALAYRVDLGLEPRDLSVQVLQRNLQRARPVVRGDLVGLYPLDLVPLGQVGRAVRQLGQLGIQLGDLEQRMLLRDFRFHFPPPP